MQTKKKTVFHVQLDSIPVANQAAKTLKPSETKIQLSIPLQHQGWTKSLRSLLPLSKEKNIEIEGLGAEIFLLCDGKRTVEKIIDLHKDRWKLSFFESRAMIFQFLKELMQRNLIVMVAPMDTKQSDE